MSESIKPVSYKAKPTRQQVAMLVELIEESEELAKNLITPAFTKKDRRNKWEEIAMRLNNLRGAVKNCSKWNKCWNDKKLDTKKKARRILNGAEETLTDLDKRVLKMIGVSAEEMEAIGVMNDVEEQVNEIEVSGNGNAKVVNDVGDIKEEVTTQFCDLPTTTPTMSTHNPIITRVAATSSSPSRVFDRRRICGKKDDSMLSVLLQQNRYMERMAACYERQVACSERQLACFEQIAQSLQKQAVAAETQARMSEMQCTALEQLTHIVAEAYPLVDES